MNRHEVVPARRHPGKAAGLIGVAMLVLAGAWYFLLRGSATPPGDGEPHVTLPAAPPSEPPAEPLAPPAVAPAVAPREEGKLATRVVGVLQGDSRLPFAGGRVHLVPAPASDVGIGAMFSFSNREDLERLERVFGERRPARSQDVAPDGRFVFEEPPPGRYELAFDHPMLLLAGSTVFAVAKGEERDLGLVATRPGGGLLVVVTDPAGAPVAGAELTLCADFDPMSFADPEKLGDLFTMLRELRPATGRTDARGTHRFAATGKAGTYLLVVDAARLSPAQRPVTILEGVPTIVRLRLDPAGAVRVRARDPAGGPVAGAVLTVVPEAPETAATGFFLAADRFGRRRGRTDADGWASIEGVRPGQVAIGLEAPGYLHFEQDGVVPVGQVLTREVTLDPGLAVSGTVLDELDQPVAGATVANAPELGESFLGISASSLVPDELLGLRQRERGPKTDATGRFVLRGLVAGRDVHLIAVAEGFALGKLGPVTPGTDGHVLRVEALGALQGRAVAADTGEPLAGPSAWCSKTHFLVFEGKVGRLESGGDGRFTLAGVPQGRQTLVVEAPGRSALRRAVTVTRGTQDLGDLRLGPTSSSAGVVVDEAGVPLESVSVRLARGGIADFMALARMRGQEIATTDAEGRFRIADAPARRIKLLAEKAGYAVHKTPPIAVVEGQETGPVRIVLDRGGSVRGHLRDAEGAPLIGWRAQLTSNDAVTVRVATSDSDGTLLFTGLAPAVYQVQAFAPDWMRGLQRMAMKSARRTSEASMPDMGAILGESLRNILQTKVTVRAAEEAAFELVWEGPVAAGATRVTGTVQVGSVPVARGFVELLDVGGQPRMQLARVDGGRFEFAAVPPGAYRVRVRPGFLSAASFSDEVVHVPAVPHHTLTLELPGGRIAGRVVYEKTGQPAAHVAIQLVAGDTAHFNPELLQDLGHGIWLTDDAGRFAFEGLGAGRYELVARELAFGGGGAAGGKLAGLDLVAAGRLEDLVVPIGGGGRLTVRVLRAGIPAPQVLVRLLTAEGRPAQTFEPQLTDGQGNAAFAGLPVGRYRALADLAGSAPTMSEPIQVLADDEASAELTLGPGVEVRLTVRGELPALRQGEVLVYSVWDAEGRLVRAGSLPVASLPAASSGVSVGSLRPGRYRLRVESPSLGLLGAEREVAATGPVEWAVEVRAPR